MTDVELAALAAYVATITDHPQIDVLPGGVLDEERDGHAAGTVYVTVTVPTVAAAELAAQRLRDLARVDEAAWRSGWRLVEGAALELDFYLESNQPETRAFLERELAEQTRRRADLEAVVRDGFVSTAPDVLITDSGVEDAGRTFVAIRVHSVDGAERAERALTSLGLERPWRVDGSALVARVYL
jgi:hypothetical protein